MPPSRHQGAVGPLVSGKLIAETAITDDHFLRHLPLLSSSFTLLIVFGFSRFSANWGFWALGPGHSCQGCVWLTGARLMAAGGNIAALAHRAEQRAERRAQSRARQTARASAGLSGASGIGVSFRNAAAGARRKLSHDDHILALDGAGNPYPKS